MKKVLQRGFTLIELLVVIAIIGILAAVVLASLNDARQSGSDAAIQQSLGNARSQAEIVFNRNGDFDYDAVCDDGQVGQLVTAAAETTGAATSTSETDTTAGGGTATCLDEATNWAIAAPLASDDQVAWCVDSSGFAGRVTGSSALDATAGDISCGN